MRGMATEKQRKIHIKIYFPGVFDAIFPSFLSSQDLHHWNEEHREDHQVNEDGFRREASW